jgi:hypothetical protein
VHLLAAADQQAGTVLAQAAVDSKTNEHPVRPAGGTPGPGSVMACQTVQPGRIRPGYAGLCGAPRIRFCRVQRANSGGDVADAAGPLPQGRRSIWRRRSQTVMP